MMNSSVDEDFPPNPFRSGGDGSGHGGNAFATAPAPAPMMQQQQPQFAPQQQPPMQQQQQQAQFQNANTGFMNSSMGNETMGGSMDPTTPQSTPNSWWHFCIACFRLETYQKYFDVDTEDIRKRIMAAMTHFHQPQFFRNNVVGPEQMSMQPTNADLKGPDLYGPVWITFVLILLVAATANWSAHLRYSTDVEKFEYDINHLLHAWSFLTVFVFGVPTVLWFTTRCMALNALTLPEWICYYGYSMVPYLPASLLCIIPVNFIAWIVMLVASGASGLLVLRNASTPLLASDTTATKAPPLILAMVGAHFIFFVSFTITFYHHGKPKHLT